MGAVLTAGGRKTKPTAMTVERWLALLDELLRLGVIYGEQHRLWHKRKAWLEANTDQWGSDLYTEREKLTNLAMGAWSDTGSKLMQLGDVLCAAYQSSFEPYEDNPIESRFSTVEPYLPQRWAMKAAATGISDADEIARMVREDIENEEVPF